MDKIILRPNAIPVYGFLSMINARKGPGKGSRRSGRILDCGAGGPLPPLALFAQHGFEPWGIDISDSQLDQAIRFCQEEGIKANLQGGDMRALPFEDGFFDFVFEHYAMCHLSKADTQKAVDEMRRVIKPDGFCFLGVISSDTWPRSMFGEEEKPGEFWGEEEGERRMHSLFTEAESDQLVSSWEVLRKEKQVLYFQSWDHKASLEEWMARYRDTSDGPSQEEWQGQYQENAGAFEYHHLYYTLKKA